MKKITLLALTGLLLSFTSCNKENGAPQKVKDAFEKKFPTATNVTWDMESDKEWEAEFKMNGKEHSSNFMVDGSWVETEYEVGEADVPQIVMEALKTNFEGYKIEEMEYSETADGKVYEFGIEKDENEMEVAIDANGNIVKKEEKKAEDNEDGDNEDND
ncbi:PepSY-like domain-containing protein [Mariniflexile sp.]|uniref:PepSY-like domain-containing protein n=1 Tax=Mariniflexile sp. TaxID=1979402 RepID=UPI0040476D0C